MTKTSSMLPPDILNPAMTTSGWLRVSIEDGKGRGIAPRWVVAGWAQSEDARDGRAGEGGMQGGKVKMSGQQWVNARNVLRNGSGLQNVGVGRWAASNQDGAEETRERQGECSKLGSVVFTSDAIKDRHEVTMQPYLPSLLRLPSLAPHRAVAHSCLASDGT